MQFAELRTTIDEFLDVIFPLPQRFGVIIPENDGDETEPTDLFLFEDEVHSIDPEATVRFGVSKIVIISPKLNGIVIKIPFNGYFSKTEDEYEDPEWHPFNWATGSDASDYCLAEYEKYKELKAQGLDCFVAKTVFYKTVHGVRVFLQERATPENDLYQTCKPSQNSQDLANKWYREDKFAIDPEWIANCIDRYGKSKVEKFLYYCNNVDLDILEDAHHGNYGYRGNETPCILDYSNYKDY